MNNERKKILTIISIMALLLTVVGATFAYFAAQGGETVTRDVNVTTHTVDALSFSIDDDIEIEITQDNFVENGVNQSGESEATILLTPNSKTGSATKNYYLYLNLSENGINYSEANTNHDPELMIQVFDSSDNLVTLTGLGNQKTVGALTGYDITGYTGLIPLLNNHTITASNYNPTTESYRVVITCINHNFNQNDNTGKKVTTRLFVQTEASINPVEVTYSNPDYTSCTNINCALNELFGEL